MDDPVLPAFPTLVTPPTPEDIQGLMALAQKQLAAGHPHSALKVVIVLLRLQGEEAVVEALHRARFMYLAGCAALNNAAVTDELSALLASCAIAEGSSPAPTTTGLPHAVPQGSGTRAEAGWRTGQGGGPQVGEQAGERGWREGLVGAAAGPSADSQDMEQDDMDLVHRPDLDAFDSMLRSAGYFPGPSRQVPILAETGRLQVLTDASADGSSLVCPYCRGLVKALRVQEHLRYWCSGTT